jgi:hypothetical protein
MNHNAPKKSDDQNNSGQARKRGAFSFSVFSLSKLSEFVFGPVDPCRLRLFERIFSITFLIYVAGWSLYAREWLTDHGFHLSPELMRRAYPTPFPTLPDWLLPFFLMVMFGSAIARILGLGGKVAQGTLLACAIYIQLADLTSAFTLNKLYIVTFCILFLTPPPKKILNPASSVVTAYQSAWPIRVIQCTLLIQYGTAGLCKLFHGDWHQRSDVLFTQSVGLYRTEIAAFLAHHLPMAGWAVVAGFALLFELFAPILFIIPRTRAVGILSGVALHVGIALMMKDLVFFSLQMMSFYVLFISARHIQLFEQFFATQAGRLNPFQNPSRIGEPRPHTSK